MTFNIEIVVNERDLFGEVAKGIVLRKSERKIFASLTDYLSRQYPDQRAPVMTPSSTY